jgi:hypothetical protein
LGDLTIVSCGGGVQFREPESCAVKPSIVVNRASGLGWN